MTGAGLSFGFPRQCGQFDDFDAVDDRRSVNPLTAAGCDQCRNAKNRFGLLLKRALAFDSSIALCVAIVALVTIGRRCR